jgi:hypothetical protein
MRGNGLARELTTPVESFTVAGVARRRADTAEKARKWLLEEPDAPVLVDGTAALPLIEKDRQRRGLRPDRRSQIVWTRAAALDAERIEFACWVAVALLPPDTRLASWCAYGTARQDHRGFYIDELSITALHPESSLPRAIDSRVIRDVKPAEILEALRDEFLCILDFAELYDRLGVTALSDEERVRLQEATREQTGRRRRKPIRRRRPPEFYKQLALVYLELQAQGVKRGIRAQLAERLELDASDAQRVPDLIRRARELGFLSYSKSGRVDAEPGPNLTQARQPRTKRKEES